MSNEHIQIHEQYFTKILQKAIISHEEEKNVTFWLKWREEGEKN